MTAGEAVLELAALGESEAEVLRKRECRVSLSVEPGSWTFSISIDRYIDRYTDPPVTVQ